MERSGTLISAYQPDSDLTALIERYRTGPFRPEAQVYESIAHDEADAVFGIDLRREGAWRVDNQDNDGPGVIPQVISALLSALEEAYKQLPTDLGQILARKLAEHYLKFLSIEKRKAWIYEVPLGAVHHLREVLNGLKPEEPISPEIFVKYDAPVLASTVKLWLLELDPPLALYEGWDELRKLYPTVGSAGTDENLEHRLQEVSSALQKLPKVHLSVLDTVVKHIRALVNYRHPVMCQSNVPYSLIDSTSVEESEEVYIAKVSLSLGRSQSSVTVNFDPKLTRNLFYSNSQTQGGDGVVNPRPAPYA